MRLKATENIVVLGLFLGVIGVLSALLLGAVSQVTREPIERAKQENFARNLKKLVPDFDARGAEKEFDGIKFFQVTKSGKVAAIFASASTNEGYAGKIEVLAALDGAGKVLNLLVTENKETPGLGKDVCERKVVRTISNPFPKVEGLPPNELLDQYRGKDAAANWEVAKDGGEFAYRTGATVTSRALVRLTGKIVKTFAAHRAEIVED